MRHISLPGLSLAAGVIVAAVLALLVLKGSDGTPPGGPMPPDAGGRVTQLHDASEAQYVAGSGMGAVLGESARQSGSAGATR
jgi:hypothetical protein